MTILEFKDLMYLDWPVEKISRAVLNRELFQLFPGLEPMLQPHNNPYHQETWPELDGTIWAHVMNVFAHACIRSKDDPPQDKMIHRLASLFHDIGKPSCRKEKNGHDIFLLHDTVGASMTRNILEEYFSPDIVDPVVEAVRKHMNIHDLPKIKVAHKARRLLGNPHSEYIIELGICDTKGTHNEVGSPEPDCSNLINSISKWNQDYPVMLPDPVFSKEEVVNVCLEWIMKKETSEVPDQGFFDRAFHMAYNDQLDGYDNWNGIRSHLKSLLNGGSKKIFATK